MLHADEWNRMINPPLSRPTPAPVYPITLLLGLVSGLSFLPVMASDAPPASLGTIVTTAASRAQPVEDVTASVQVISQEDLASYAGASVTKALTLATGVDARPLGSNSDVKIRGFSLMPGALLIDGLRRPSKYGSVNTNLIELENIDRIEVIRGPMSALYGADATGGAINILTRSPLLDEGTHGRIHTSWGTTTAHRQRDTRLSGAAIAFGTGDVRHRVSVEQRNKGLFRQDPHASEGPADLNKLNQTFAAYEGGVRLGGDHQLRWQAEYMRQNDTGPGQQAGTGARYDAYEKEKRGFGALHYTGQVGPGTLDAAVAYGRSDGSTTRSYPIIETSDYRQLQSQLRYGMEVGNHFLLVGTGFTRDAIDININSQYGRRNNTYLLVQDEWKLPNDWQALLGLRYDRFSDFGSAVTPRASLQKTLGRWSTRVGYGEAYRAPTVVEQYSTFTRGTTLIVGNPELSAEKNRSWEAAVAYRGDTADAELVYHQSRIRDMIQTRAVSRLPSDPVQIRSRSAYVNVAAARMRGVELSGNWQLGGGWSLQGGWEYLDARDADTDQRITGIARQIARAGIRYVQGPWRVDVIGRYYLDFYAADPAARAGVPFDTNYGTLDLKAQYAWSRGLTLAVGMDNVFDRQQPVNFGARGSVIDPPVRFAYVSAEYRF